ncbi:hypothetical protein B0H66DRAFT_161587 [Apodospora peruviana]|uniref:DUF218 domain-containing protein n=1 Tax=Apodospora peruviana TaxID=516989 RepID=A0AAE0MBV7_9PEZI|nr:hypothetical protein B0H66DRAFT_161587 [Apodospora peruviana]
MSLPNHLIIVCGHGIWKGGPKNGWDEAEWLIESYKQGETPTFIEHIKAGVRALSEDKRALLVFSGGSTRPETRLSEAQSYHNLAIANSYFGFLSSGDEAESRILAEERALDSYYNIVFSLIEFWRFTGHRTWPEHVTIVSHGFKRARLVDAHCCGAIGFPPDRVAFIGINPPGMEEVTNEGRGTGNMKADAMRGVQLAIGQWAKDPHGVGEELTGKRRARNCWKVDQGMFRDYEEQSLSGVDVQVLPDGTEALLDDGSRPWNKA